MKIVVSLNILDGDLSKNVATFTQDELGHLDVSANDTEELRAAIFKIEEMCSCIKGKMTDEQ